LLRAERTVGGHRRFRFTEITRFLSRQNIEPARPPSSLTELGHRRPFDSPAAGPQTLALLQDALRGGREEEAAALLVDSYLRGEAIASIFDELLCAAMNLIGELWYRAELTIAEEHLATRTAASALHTLRMTVSAPEEKALTAVCCSVENDLHELPAHLAQIIFESEGWRAVNLGANVPFFALHDAVRRYGPQLVCVSSTILSDLDRTEHEYKDFLLLAGELGLRIVLGGRGFTSDERVRGRFYADFYAESFSQLRQFISSIEGLLTTSRGEG
jgi:MerR family transcriptional regulator, light-induced transcriptional regulator